MLKERIRLKAIHLISITIICLYILGCEAKKKEINEDTAIITYGTPEYMPAQRQLHREILTVFKEEHPDIQVKVEYNTMEKVLVQMAGNTAPDVFYWLPFDLPEIANKGQTLDMEPFISKDKSFDLNDFYQAGLNMCKYKGNLHALPIQLATSTLFYNQDVFDKKGLSYIDDTWTWDGYLEAARRLTIDADNDGRVEQYGTLLLPWGFILGSYEIKFFNYAMTEIMINTTEFRQILQYLIDLKIKYNVAPGIDKLKEFGGDTSMFSSWRVAMFCGSSWMLTEFAKIKNFRWDIAPLPKGMVRDSRIVGGINCISSKTKHPKAAWEFLKFYASKKGLTLQGKMKNCIPSRKSIANSQIFNSPPPVHIQYLLANIEIGIFEFPVSPNKMTEQGKWSDTILDYELQLAYLGKQTVEETVQNLVHKTKRFIAEESK